LAVRKLQFKLQSIIMHYMCKYMLILIALCGAGRVLVVAAPLEVVVSEVAWMGTQASTADEWIELYNPGATAVALTGWVLRWGKRTVNLSGVIEARGYFLLERSDDRTVADVDADLVYTGGLTNAGEVLELLDAQGNPIDVVNPDGGPWPAGDSHQKATMQRIQAAQPGTDDNWSTSTPGQAIAHDAQGQPIWGTPRQQNFVTHSGVVSQKLSSAETSVPMQSRALPAWTGIVVGLGVVLFLAWLMLG